MHHHHHFIQNCCINYKAILQFVVLIVGLVGLYLEFNAAINLFKQVKGLKEIKPLSDDTFMPFDAIKDPAQDFKSLEIKLNNAIRDTTANYKNLYKDLVAKINDQIKEVYKTHEDEYKEDKKRWISQLKWGAFISAFALLLSFVISIFL